MANTYTSTHTGDWFDSILDLVYPVGSVYISVNSTSPATLFGGTWVQIQDKFLLGCGSTYTNGSTGGSSGHTHVQVSTTSGEPSNNTSGSTTLTVSQMPSHGHLIYVWDNAGTTGNAYYFNGATQTTHTGARLYNASASTWIASGSTAAAAGSGRGDPSGGAAKVGGGTGHTHTLSSHTHTTPETNTGGASSLPPYLVVYMWKRTA